MKKAKVIDLLLNNKDKLSQKRISQIVGCDYRYVNRLADILGLVKKVPIMDFRGLLKGNICQEK